jgi:hypothetical protein
MVAMHSVQLEYFALRKAISTENNNHPENIENHEPSQFSNRKIPAPAVEYFRNQAQYNHQYQSLDSYQPERSFEIPARVGRQNKQG